MKTPRRDSAFTLIEVLVASGIVVVIMGVLLSMTDQTQRLVRSTSSKVEQFQDARVGFESMTRRLAQATLNTFWDYQYDQDGIPIRYERAAELRFRSGPASALIPSRSDRAVSHAVFFQAPIGLVENPGAYGMLDHLLNTWGYFVEVSTDRDDLPAFLANKVTERRRYRLMEAMQPAERIQIYSQAAQAPTSPQWFASVFQGAQPPVRVLTENVVALVILPRLSLADEQQWMRDPENRSPNRPPILAPSYAYDSTQGTNDPILNPKNQLPPVVQVVMVAIDEASAQRLQDDPQYGGNQHLGISYNPDPFSGRPLFRDPKLLEDDRTGTIGDISRLEKLLTSRKVSYRVFATNVSIRGAKWSRGQQN
jgi:uncharacterized protein (TIGR02599 family)